MPSADAPLLDARGLVHRYGRTPVLAGVDLQLARGEVLLLLGANGAGKSTLLRALAGLARPDAGTVLIEGARVAEARGRIGYLAHDILLYDDLTVAENLAFTARLHGGIAPAEVVAAIDRVRLSPQRDRLVRHLSRGQRQRAALARALLHRPDLLLFDEPFTGLDAENVAALTEMLRAAAAAGKAAVVVGHHPDEGWEAVTRVGVLARGRWAHVGPRPPRPEDARQLYQEALGG
jgi:heme ABC exporter ATP-binding subunit CcmA